VPGAISEKFVLAIVLLDAFLHGQGQEATKADASNKVRSLPFSRPDWRMMLHRRNALSDGMRCRVCPAAAALPGNIATAEAVGRMEIASGPAVVRVGGGSGAAALHGR
jgi:hypothetical protein